MPSHPIIEVTMHLDLAYVALNVVIYQVIYFLYMGLYTLFKI